MEGRFESSHVNTPGVIGVLLSFSPFVRLYHKVKLGRKEFIFAFERELLGRSHSELSCQSKHECIVMRYCLIFNTVTSLAHTPNIFIARGMQVPRSVLAVCRYPDQWQGYAGIPISGRGMQVPQSVSAVCRYPDQR